MAFKEQNLSCVSNNQKTGVVPALWIYWNEGSDTVTTAGYIPAKYGMSAKDQVLVDCVYCKLPEENVTFVLSLTENTPIPFTTAGLSESSSEG